MSRTGREHVLARALRGVTDRYDHALIDRPPSPGVLTLNGLTAAREVLVPLPAELLAHRGLGQLLDTVTDVRSFTNPELTVLEVVVTMSGSRTRMSREVVGDPIPPTTSPSSSRRSRGR